MNMCPGSCQKLGRGCRKGSCCNSQSVHSSSESYQQKNNRFLPSHTHLCYWYSSCLLSLSLCVAFSSLLSLIHLITLSFSSNTPTGSEACSHIWCQSHTVTYLCTVSVACVAILCFIFLSRFPNHTHAAFMTVPDKQCPASWPQVQVAIKLSLKWRLFSGQQTDLINLVGLYFSSNATLWHKQWAVILSSSAWLLPIGEDELNMCRWGE